MQEFSKLFEEVPLNRRYKFEEQSVGDNFPYIRKGEDRVEKQKGGWPSAAPNENVLRDGLITIEPNIRVLKVVISWAGASVI